MTKPITPAEARKAASPGYNEEGDATFIFTPKRKGAYT